jgi:hypothetical protein
LRATASPLGDEKENTRKYSLDFADAWQIFDAPMLTALDTKEEYGEDRFT